MQNNYFFLSWLIRWLRKDIIDTRLMASYSQEREVLVLHFFGKKDTYLQAHLRSEFTCLSFPERHHRAKRNSADIFQELIGRTVADVVMVRNDRSFFIHFDNEESLLFKMHGNRSNVIRVGPTIDPIRFKNSLKADINIDLNSLSKPDPTQREYLAFEGNLQRLFPVLGAELIKNLEKLLKGVNSSEEEWKIFDRHLRELRELNKCYLCETEELPALSLLPTSPCREFDDPMRALNQFFARYQSKRDFLVRKKNMLRDINREIAKTSTYVNKTSRELAKLSTGFKDADMADLVMANLHKFTPGQQEVDLRSFDGLKTITVRIKEGTSAIAYAQNLYRKSKNRKIQLDTLEENLRRKEWSLKQLLEKKQLIENSEELKTLQPLETKVQKTGSTEKSVEYLEFEHDGFKIKVGRNAKNNDKLTFAEGYKEDLWLHVKDTKGSHVLLKYRSDRKFPKPTIEKAAQLAAWFSKRKTESVVPVIFTPRKFVRKRKGDPPGAVVVDKEEVILVAPEKW